MESSCVLSGRLQFPYQDRAVLYWIEAAEFEWMFMDCKTQVSKGQKCLKNGLQDFARRRFILSNQCVSLSREQKQGIGKIWLQIREN